MDEGWGGELEKYKDENTVKASSQRWSSRKLEWHLDLSCKELDERV